MIIYSITYSINNPQAEEWLSWLKETHLPRVMSSSYFFRFTLQELIDPLPDPERRTFNLQFYTLEVHNLYEYWDEDAHILDGAMEERFGDQLSSFETVMKRFPQPVQ